jgi:hypothetical protein
MVPEVRGMARRPPLHDAGELLAPAVERTLAAVDPPESDAALVALARALAGSLDRMSQDERRAMLGQTVPQLLKVLVEIERRATVRRPAEPPRVSQLDLLRAARRRRDRR